MWSYMWSLSLSQLVINFLSSTLSSDMSHLLLVCPATISIKFLMNPFYELVFLTPVSSHFPMLACLASSLGWFFQRNGIFVSLLSSKMFYCVLTAKLMFLVFSLLFQHVTMFFKPVDFVIDPNNTWHSPLCLLSMLLQLLRRFSLHISVLVMSPGPALLAPSPQSLPLLVMLWKLEQGLSVFYILAWLIHYRYKGCRGSYTATCGWQIIVESGCWEPMFVYERVQLCKLSVEEPSWPGQGGGNEWVWAMTSQLSPDSPSHFKGTGEPHRELQCGHHTHRRDKGLLPSDSYICTTLSISLVCNWLLLLTLAKAVHLLETSSRTPPPWSSLSSCSLPLLTTHGDISVSQLAWLLHSWILGLSFHQVDRRFLSGRLNVIHYDST